MSGEDGEETAEVPPTSRGSAGEAVPPTSIRGRDVDFESLLEDEDPPDGLETVGERVGTPIGDITEEANEVVTADRDSHGEAYENHRQIAEFWSTLLEDKLTEDIEPYEAAIAMTLVKISRMQAGSVEKDHFRDIAGYADVAWTSAVRHPETSHDLGEE